MSKATRKPRGFLLAGLAAGGADRQVNQTNLIGLDPHVVRVKNLLAAAAEVIVKKSLAAYVEPVCQEGNFAGLRIGT